MDQSALEIWRTRASGRGSISLSRDYDPDVSMHTTFGPHDCTHPIPVLLLSLSFLLFMMLVTLMFGLVRVGESFEFGSGVRFLNGG